MPPKGRNIAAEQARVTRAANLGLYSSGKNAVSTNATGGAHNVWAGHHLKGGSLEISRDLMQATKDSLWWPTSVRAPGWGTEFCEYLRQNVVDEQIEFMQKFLQEEYDQGGEPAGSLSGPAMTALQGVIDSRIYAKPNLSYTAELVGVNMYEGCKALYLATCNYVYDELTPTGAYS